MPLSNSGSWSSGCLALHLSWWWERQVEPCLIWGSSMATLIGTTRNKSLTLNGGLVPCPWPKRKWAGQGQNKANGQGVLTVWLKTVAYTKRSMCYDFSSLGANEFPLGFSQLEMNYLSFVARIYPLRKNDSTPMTNSTVHSGTIR